MDNAAEPSKQALFEIWFRRPGEGSWTLYDFSESRDETVTRINLTRARHSDWEFEVREALEEH